MLRVALSGLLLSCAIAAQSSPPASKVAEEERDPVQERFHKIAEGQIKTLSEAYQLTPDQVNWLQSEMDRRVSEAPAFNERRTKLFRDRGDAMRMGRPTQEIEREIREMQSNDPMNLDNIMAELESRLPDPQREEGRARVQVLRRRVREQGMARIKEGTKEGVKAREMAAGVADAKEPQRPLEPVAMKPELHGKAGAIDTGAQPGVLPVKTSEASKEVRAAKHAAAGEAGDAKSAAPSSREPGAKAAPKGTTEAAKRDISKTDATKGDKQPPPEKTRPEPPSRGSKPAKLGAWDKIVQDLAAKYGFTDAQRATAGGILKDCERRAEAYRAVKAPEYERLASIKDAAQRSGEQSRLDAPLVAMEQELIERVETLATGAQRAAAEAAGKKKK